MVNVTLDMETFKALASETRLQVLRALDARRKTLSELSRELGLNKATVHEHLQLLTATGLIKKRDDEGRKWIYYELTWRGERLLHPQETTTFAVLLGVAILAASIGVVFFGGALDIWMDQAASEPMVEEGPSIAAAPAADQQNDTAQKDGPESGEPAGALRAADPPASASDPDDTFWDDGGLVAVLLMVTSGLAVVLAIAIRARTPRSS